MMILSLKIIFKSIFYVKTVEFVIKELKRDKKLRKFFEIQDDIQDALQISEFIARFKADKYIKIVNNILMQTKPLKKTWKTNIHC